MKPLPETNDPRGPMTPERAYGTYSVPKPPEGTEATLGVVEDGDWFLNYRGRLVQKRPQDVIIGPRLVVTRTEE